MGHQYENGKKLRSVTATEVSTLNGITATTAELNILDGVTAIAAELNTLDVTAQQETIDSSEAADVSVGITYIDNTDGGAGAITLAVPGAANVGRIKVIEMGVDGGDVTLALTNVQGGTAATTATFDAVGEALTVIATNATKWTVLKEFGVTLS